MSNDKDQVIIQEANLELRKLIEKLNTIKNKWILVILTGVISISSLWQFFGEGDNPFWSNTKILLLLFYAIVILNFTNSYKKLNANIKSVETNF